jgi:hypothetical protein
MRSVITISVYGYFKTIVLRRFGFEMIHKIKIEVIDSGKQTLLVGVNSYI